jgi:DNA-binding response OmpR family regulator
MLRGEATILVVDDDSAGELYREVLSGRGYQVITARDGEAGLAAALALRPDLVVTDLALPRLDGLELVRRLRRHPATRRSWIVMVTGRVEPRWQRAAIDAGCDAFLRKPCPLGELVHQVRRLLEDRTDEPTVRLRVLTPPGARSGAPR